MRKALLLLGVMLYFLPTLMATHNRAGEIVYRKLPGNSLRYEIKVITYTEDWTCSSAYRDSLQLMIHYCPQATEAIDTIWVYGDRVRGQLPQLIVDCVRRTEYTIERDGGGSYTLPGPGCYRMSILDPNRVDDIINIGGSVNVPFYIEDTLQVIDPQFFGFNSSPVLLQHPIVFAQQYEEFRHNPGAYDIDGDSLIFTLIPPLENQNIDVPGYKYPDHPDFIDNAAFPNEFSIDRFTGEINWNVPQIPGIYNIAILIREYRDGRYIGSMIRDMQIWVIQGNNDPPRVSDLQDTCVIAGEQLRAFLTATDPGDKIDSFTATGGPFVVGNSPAVWNHDAPRFSPANGIFTWNTNCSHVRRNRYVVVFTATDDMAETPLSDAETWLIKVVGPPPQGLQTRIDQPNKRIEIEWDSLYTCDNSTFENFIGFTVWRKRGCDSTVLDNCEAGNLEAYGYQRISPAKPINDYRFFDQNAKVGVVYSYRVQAEFAESVPNSGFFYNQVASVPSNADCAQLKSDLPVITNADVRETNETNGVVMVKWYPPDQEALDTFKNPGPYKYELFSHTGLNPGTGTTLLQTYNAQNFSDLLPDSFRHTNINTLSRAHSYTIRFFATDPSLGEYEVGVTEGASTVFLQSVASNKQIVLNWRESVPWANYLYEVYRNHPDSLPTDFDLVATTSDNRYFDVGLKNKLEYCYFIRSFGSYNNVRLPDTLINNSQIWCDVPRDTNAPCSPQLTILNNCEEAELIDPGNFVNELSWTDPRTECGDFDLAGYKIYYSQTDRDSLQLLTEIPDPDILTFNHTGLSSLAGCYVVTAVDTFENESSINNRTCLDNCPLYRLPNAFTPNGDGDNDLFTPILPYLFIDRIDIKIYNRWGNIVYQTNDPSINWDGNDFRTGKPVPEGTYHYVCEVFELRVSGVEKLQTPLSGYIQLVRGN